MARPVWWPAGVIYPLPAFGGPATLLLRKRVADAEREWRAREVAKEAVRVIRSKPSPSKPVAPSAPSAPSVPSAPSAPVPAPLPVQPSYAPAPAPSAAPSAAPVDAMVPAGLPIVYMQDEQQIADASAATATGGGVARSGAFGMLFVAGFLIAAFSGGGRR